MRQRVNPGEHFRRRNAIAIQIVAQHQALVGWSADAGTRLQSPSAASMSGHGSGRWRCPRSPALSVASGSPRTGGPDATRQSNESSLGRRPAPAGGRCRPWNARHPASVPPQGARRQRRSQNSVGPGPSTTGLARHTAPECCSRRPAHTRGIGPVAFNAHSRAGGRSGLVQHAFRSPARIPAMERR